MCSLCDAPGPAQGPAKADPRAEVLDRLEAKLLAIGGTRLVRKPPDPNPEDVLERGQLIDLPVRLRRGQRSRCHVNSAALWGTDVRRFRLVTGYALSDDGLWRQHSWVLDGKRIIETTARRDRYFGVVLDPFEATRFWWANFLVVHYPGPVSLMKAAQDSAPPAEGQPVGGQA